MAVEADIYTAGAWTVGGTSFVTLVFLSIRHMIMRVSKDATTVVADATYREQLGGLRDEIHRLEEVIQKQSEVIAQMNSQIMALRFAFVDEQAALLRILNEMNNDDPAVKARISAEIEAANQRRVAVMAATNGHLKEVVQ